jgi:hypothetical protein
MKPLDVHILFVARRIEGETKGFDKPNSSGDWVVIIAFHRASPYLPIYSLGPTPRDFNHSFPVK